LRSDQDRDPNIYGKGPDLYRIFWAPFRHFSCPWAATVLNFQAMGRRSAVLDTHPWSLESVLDGITEQHSLESQQLLEGTMSFPVITAVWALDRTIGARSSSFCLQAKKVNTFMEQEEKDQSHRLHHRWQWRRSEGTASVQRARRVVV
jgi:hypothetical protein